MAGGGPEAPQGFGQPIKDPQGGLPLVLRVKETHAVGGDAESNFEEFDFKNDVKIKIIEPNSTMGNILKRYEIIIKGLDPYPFLYPDLRSFLHCLDLDFLA